MQGWLSWIWHAAVKHCLKDGDKQQAVPVQILKVCWAKLLPFGREFVCLCTSRLEAIWAVRLLFASPIPQPAFIADEACVRGLPLKASAATHDLPQTCTVLSDGFLQHLPADDACERESKRRAWSDA